MILQIVFPIQDSLVKKIEISPDRKEILEYLWLLRPPGLPQNDTADSPECQSLETEASQNLSQQVKTGGFMAGAFGAGSRISIQSFRMRDWTSLIDRVRSSNGQLKAESYLSEKKVRGGHTANLLTILHHKLWIYGMIFTMNCWQYKNTVKHLVKLDCQSLKRLK